MKEKLSPALHTLKRRALQGIFSPFTFSTFTNFSHTLFNLFFFSHFPSFSLHPSMNSSSTLLANISFSCFARQFKELSTDRGKLIQLRLKKNSEAKFSVKCNQVSDSVLYSSPPERFNLPRPNLSVSRAGMTYEAVVEKLKRLVLEFESLTEPIDRVKRLLHYAARLPRFDESARVEANRVTGCTTQVWLEARLDECGRVRFCADSDSEITKGFISCLIWILDGAEAEEVLMVKAEDLRAMNVGIHGKAQSRVNTWHNVLISMQKRTMVLVAERERESPTSVSCCHC